MTNRGGASVAASIGAFSTVPIEAATDAPSQFVTSPHSVSFCDDSKAMRKCLDRSKASLNG